MLQLFTRPKTWEGYYAGRLSKLVNRPMMRIADEPPRKWELVTRDLFKDFGPITITGINFSAMEGPGIANFDHVYLGRTIEDLDRIKERQAKVAPPVDVPGVAEEPTSSARAWVLPVVIGGAAVVLLCAGVLLILVIRRGARKPQAAGVKRGKNEARESSTVVEFPCVGCGKRLKATAALAGKSVKCPHCGKRTVIPAADARS